MKQGAVIGTGIKGFILDWVVMEGFSEDMTFGLKRER